MVNPRITPLAKDVTLAGLAASAGGDWLYFKIDVPKGATNLTFSTAGGVGDADLYVRRQFFPTATKHDKVSTVDGNTERCTIASPEAGTWYVALMPYKDFSGLSLVGSYVVPGTVHRRARRGSS